MKIRFVSKLLIGLSVFLVVIFILIQVSIEYNWFNISDMFLASFSPFISAIISIFSSFVIFTETINYYLEKDKQQKNEEFEKQKELELIRKKTQQELVKPEIMVYPKDFRKIIIPKVKSELYTVLDEFEYILHFSTHDNAPDDINNFNPLIVGTYSEFGIFKEGSPFYNTSLGVMQSNQKLFGVFLLDIKNIGIGTLKNLFLYSDKKEYICSRLKTDSYMPTALNIGESFKTIIFMELTGRDENNKLSFFHSMQAQRINMSFQDILGNSYVQTFALTMIDSNKDSSYVVLKKEGNRIFADNYVNARLMNVFAVPTPPLQD